MMMISVVFYSHWKGGAMAADGSAWLPVCFLVFLPLLGVVWQTFARREAALRELAEGARSHAAPARPCCRTLAALAAATLKPLIRLNPKKRPLQPTHTRRRSESPHR